MFLSLPCTIIFPVFFQNLLYRVQFSHSLVVLISSNFVQLVVLRRITEKSVILKLYLRSIVIRVQKQKPSSVARHLID